MSVAPRLSLAHLTILDADPLTLIDAAEAGGFDMLGLRIVAPMPTDRITPVVGEEALIRRIEARLRDSPARILDVEAVWLNEATDVAALLPALEVGQRLGASHLLVVGNDPDEARAADNLAGLAAAARRFGIRPMLEPIPYCRTGTLAAAQRLLARAGDGHVGLLVDALHLARGGGTAAELRGLDPGLLDYCHLCQAAGPPPEGIAALRAEARGDRLYPGDPAGRLPLREMLDALPAGVILGVEAPSAALAGLPAVERARRCGESTRALLAAAGRL